MSSISTNEYKIAGRNLKIDLIDVCEDAMCVAKEHADCVVNTVRICPHCGKSYYVENCSESTAVYYPPIYKNGVNINPDRNTTTTHCTCMNCGKDFSFMR